MYDELELDAAHGSVREARDALGNFASFLSEKRVQTAHLLVSELVTNSIRHSGIFPSDAIYLTLAGCEKGLLVEVARPRGGFRADDSADGRGDGGAEYGITGPRR